MVGELGEVTGERALAEDYVYVQIDLVITEVLAGDVSLGDVLTFEGWTSEVTQVPRGPMLLFLEEKRSDVDPPGLWTWYSSRGIWAETQRAAVDTPLAPSPPGDHPLYREDLGEPENPADVIDVVRALTQR